MGKRMVMNEDAIANYGEAWRGVVLEVTHSASRHMPAKDFFAKGSPKGYHPGYDPSSGGRLHDLRRVDTGEALGMSLYDWELAEAPVPDKEPEEPAAFRP